MAVKAAMSWIPKRKEWQKVYQGTRYRVTARALACRPTKEASIKAANEWWEQKLAEINGDPPVDLTDPDVIRYGYLDHAGNWVRCQEVSPTVGLYGSWTSTPVKPAVAREQYILTQEQDPGALANDEQRIAYARRLRDLGVEAENYPVADESETVAYQAKLFLKDLKSQKLSQGRQSMYERQIQSFEEFLGADSSVQCITSTRMTEWRQALVAKLEAGDIGDWYASQTLMASKRLCRFLWEHDLLDLPKVIENKRFVIQVETSKPIKAPSVESVKTVLKGNDKTKEQTLLYLLLALNCGMYQSDVAGIKQEEVNWQEGTITRARNKTGKRLGVTNKSARVITYHLWPLTFKLLCKYGRQTDNPADLVLLDRKGEALWKHTVSESGKDDKVDNIKKAAKRYFTALKVESISFKMFRKVSAQLLEDSSSISGGAVDYGRFVTYFLAQQPNSVKDKSYVEPNKQQMQELCGWLGEQLL